MLICIYRSFFIHLFVHGHLVCFYFLGIVNNAIVSMGVQISLQGLAFDFFGQLFEYKITTIDFKVFRVV